MFRLAPIAAAAGLVLLGLAGSLAPAHVSRAQTVATPTATPGPVSEDPCPQITSITLSTFSGGSLHPATSARLHQLVHVAVEWRLGDPTASPLQPSKLVVRHGHRVLYGGWLNVLYPHAVADVVLDNKQDRGQATITATLGTAPCSSSASASLHVVAGSPPRKPWVYPDCLSTYTATGAACWLIAGGFKPHEALSVSYRLRPGGGGKTVTGGLRGRTDGHGIFGSIALDLGPDVNWQTAVLRVDVKAAKRNLVRTVVHLTR